MVVELQVAGGSAPGREQDASSFLVDPFALPSPLLALREAGGRSFQVCRLHFNIWTHQSRKINPGKRTSPFFKRSSFCSNGSFLASPRSGDVAGLSSNEKSRDIMYPSCEIGSFHPRGRADGPRHDGEECQNQGGRLADFQAMPSSFLSPSS